jgi:hypothetical protein
MGVSYRCAKDTITEFQQEPLAAYWGRLVSGLGQQLVLLLRLSL